MLKSIIGNYSIIIDGIWCEISEFKEGVIEYGNTFDDLSKKDAAEKILVYFIAKEIENIRKNKEYDLEKIKKYLSQFNEAELKKIRIAYATRYKKELQSILIDLKSKMNVDEYIKNLK